MGPIWVPAVPGIRSRPAFPGRADHYNAVARRCRGRGRPRRFRHVYWEFPVRFDSGTLRHNAVASPPMRSSLATASGTSSYGDCIYLEPLSRALYTS